LADANQLAHEIIRELMIRAGRERDEEPAKLLLRHTTVDVRLRGEKALERLRGLVSLGCRTVPDGLPPRQLIEAMARWQVG
jgi:hypothetical protein